MDARTFLGLHPTHNRFRWSMTVEPRITNFGGNLFGGAGLAAAIVALEAVTDRPVVWASAQYLSYALTGSIIDLDVKLAIQGHNTTQARVTAHVADAEVLTVNAALGARPTLGEGTFAQRPIVPPPEDCPARSLRMPAGGTINAHIEMGAFRIGPGTRPPRRWQLARQHNPHYPAGRVRLGAARPAGPGGTQRVRSWPCASMGPGRHADGDGDQSVILRYRGGVSVSETA